MQWLWGKAQSKFDTRLIEAAQRGDLDKATKSLSNGANPNAKDEDGETPLHWASAQNHLDIVELLLAINEIDVNALNYAGNTPLHQAVAAGNDEISRELIAHSAKVDVKNASADTALDLAIRKKNWTVVETLRRAGARLSERGTSP
jgi:ankyrin repeat protein